jgi:cytochrome c-type biogenesis protein CcmF
LLINNIFLVVMMFTVLLGTLYPLFADALGMGKLSVGPPYFNFFFVPFMGILCLFMAVGPLSLWKKTNLARLWQALKHPLTISLVLAIAFPAIYGGLNGSPYSFAAAITVFVSSWIIFVTAFDMYAKASKSDSLYEGLSKFSRSYYGMVVAHFGIAVIVLGTCLNTIYSDQRDLRMETGERLQLGRYEYYFVDVKTVQGPNFTAEVGRIEIFSDGKRVSVLEPEKRRYWSTNDILTEAAIDSSFWGDRYIALGDFLGKTAEGADAWAVRVHDKPFVNWIWLGAFMMTLGGFIAVSDKRYRLKKKVDKKITTDIITGSAIAD